MNPSPLLRVPHLRDGFIVAKVVIERSETAPAHLDGAGVSNLKVKVEY
jgi:hypothetical protein